MLDSFTQQRHHHDCDFPLVSMFAAPTTQCITFNNTNYSGDVIAFVRNVENEGDCCDLCSNRQGCNIYVYCPEEQGCDDGSGRIYEGNLCTLKYQPLSDGTDPEKYGAGPDVTWISGIVTETSLGFCVGYAEAAASASAEAGCNSIAYAVSVAYAGRHLLKQ